MSWLFPVIGVTEWSTGAWMPSTKNHRGRTHAAIDIYADRGAPIVTPVSGTVKNVGSTSIGGNWIQIQGNDGNVYYFAHMNAPTHLSRNDTVTGGQQIGAIGNSGSARTTSTHVHFSVKKDGVAISPISMLQGGVVVPSVGGRTPEATVESWERGDYYTSGVGGNPPVSREAPTPADTVRGAGELYAYDSTPSTVDQFNQWFADNKAQGLQDSTLKRRASAAMRSSLEGMAQMVQRYGFVTQGPTETGIPDDMEMIQRAGEETDAATPR